MENPATCNEVEKLIHQALNDHARLLNQGFCGVGLERSLFRKLDEAGYIISEYSQIKKFPGSQQSTAV